MDALIISSNPLISFELILKWKILKPLITESKTAVKNCIITNEDSQIPTENSESDSK